MYKKDEHFGIRFWPFCDLCTSEANVSLDFIFSRYRLHDFKT